MELSNLEKDFLELINYQNHTDLDIKRVSSDILIIEKKSPCPEIQSIIAEIAPYEISLSCNITHSHFELNDYKRKGSKQPEKNMLIEASSAFNDFVEGRIIVSKEYSANGEEISSGWSHIDIPSTPNKEYVDFIRELYGNCYEKEWNWFGEIKK